MPWLGVFAVTVVMAIVFILIDPTTFNGQDLVAIALVIIGAVIAYRGMRSSSDE